MPFLPRDFLGLEHFKQSEEEEEDNNNNNYIISLIAIVSSRFIS